MKLSTWCQGWELLERGPPRPTGDRVKSDQTLCSLLELRVRREKTDRHDGVFASPKITPKRPVSPSLCQGKQYHPLREMMKTNIVESSSGRQMDTQVSIHSLMGS